MAVKITLQYNVSPAFCGINTNDLSVSYLVTESVSILQQAKRSYGASKLNVFATKRSPFCPISADTFWKIQPDICTFSYARFHTCEILYRTVTTVHSRQQQSLPRSTLPTDRSKCCPLCKMAILFLQLRCQPEDRT